MLKAANNALEKQPNLVKGLYRRGQARMFLANFEEA